MFFFSEHSAVTVTGHSTVMQDSMQVVHTYVLCSPRNCYWLWTVPLWSWEYNCGPDRK